MSEEREIPAACLGCLLELPDMAEVASRLEHLVEVMAGAASGRCSLASQTLYRLVPARSEGSGHSCIHFWCTWNALIRCGISV